jgi:hypothetical protein
VAAEPRLRLRATGLGRGPEGDRGSGRPSGPDQRPRQYPPEVNSPWPSEVPLAAAPRGVMIGYPPEARGSRITPPTAPGPNVGHGGGGATEGTEDGRHGGCGARPPAKPQHVPSAGERVTRAAEGGAQSYVARQRVPITLRAGVMADRAPGEGAPTTHAKSAAGLEHQAARRGRRAPGRRAAPALPEGARWRGAAGPSTQRLTGLTTVEANRRWVPALTGVSDDEIVDRSRGHQNIGRRRSPSVVTLPAGTA